MKFSKGQMMLRLTSLGALCFSLSGLCEAAAASCPENDPKLSLRAQQHQMQDPQ